MGGGSAADELLSLETVRGCGGGKLIVHGGGTAAATSGPPTMNVA